MKRKSSYQKLKEKYISDVTDLSLMIDILIDKPDSKEARVIKEANAFKKQKAAMLLQGSATWEEGVQGLLPQISKIGVTRTVGGYEIRDFKVLETPIDRGILDPEIYGGTIVDYPTLLEEGGLKTSYTTWDKLGRCPNRDRKDCYIFIDIK